MKHKTRKIDILDLVPEEASQKVDDLAYNFLAEQGYNTLGARDSEKVQKALQAEMRRRGERLEHHGLVNRESKAILIWFELYNGKVRKARSKGLKLMAKRW